MRWRLKLKELGYETVYKVGNADTLNRIEVKRNTDTVNRKSILEKPLNI